MATETRKRSFDESADVATTDHPTLPSTDASPNDQFGHGDRLPSGDIQSPGDWQLVQGRSKKKRKQERKQRARNVENFRQSEPETRTRTKAETRPAVTCAAPHMLNSSLRISDLQALVLYCLADGVGPQWISVCHHSQIRKAVVLMVPGLERGLFTGTIDLGPTSGTEPHTAAGQDKITAEAATSLKSSGINPAGRRSPDDFIPFKLDSSILPDCLKSFAECFLHLFPIKTPGDDRRVHSPVQAILNAPLSRTTDEKRADKATKGPKAPRLAKDFVDRPTPIFEFIASPEDLAENEFVLHPAAFGSNDNESTGGSARQEPRGPAKHDWRDAAITNEELTELIKHQEHNLHGGRKIFAVDCEMCKVKGNDESMEEFALTRISIVQWDGKVVLDELVKPDKPIVDYVTAFSGMTAEKLNPVTTTLAEIQSRLLEIFTPDSLLVGHSLNSDLNAMKLTHPCIVDTSLIYPHPKGLPFKSSLKWLTQKYLGREIQKHDGSLGHDSVEDARAALDLVKLKCQHGPQWGTPEANGEDIFKRLGRSPRPGAVASNPLDTELRDCRTGAVVDYGRPERTLGKTALVSISCSTDDEVVAGIKRAANGDADGSVVPGGGVDFVFARMRELEALRGWSTDASPNLAGSSGDDSDKMPTSVTLPDQLNRLQTQIVEIRASLPKCTLLIVYSGIGDPREMKRLSDMHREFRRQYAVQKWDSMSVKWTDIEEQSLKKAVKKARDGIAFVTVT